MPLPPRTYVIATRGSALALTQSRLVQAQLARAFPHAQFELSIIKTTGDKLQAATTAQPPDAATKGLFTKELEVALLNREADLAVHSLKDLPTDLPPGLELSAVSPRADARDVLIYRSQALAHRHGGRGLPAHQSVRDFPREAVIATSSTRRMAQLQAIRPDLQIVPIRGNVGTRLRKLREIHQLDATILAAAGLGRLGYRIEADGRLHIPATEPEAERNQDGFAATLLPLEEMLPCVGQAALGIESRAGDPEIRPVCQALNHPETFQCVAAERSFLRAMGGGCLSPIAAYAVREGNQIWLRAVSFRQDRCHRVEGKAPLEQAEELGKELAKKVGAG